MTESFNRPEQKSLRRRLRNDMPPAEQLLWSQLKGKQLPGRKFRRQYGAGAYCLDFFCAEIGLAIEVDGDCHFTDAGKLSDRERQEWIESFRIRFLRFTNEDVYRNLEGVLEVIAAAIGNSPLEKGEDVDATVIGSTPLNPPLERGEGIISENPIGAAAPPPSPQ